MRLVLASASPRRAELLTTAGIPFEIALPDVDETPHVRERPEAYALRVAKEKARAAAGQFDANQTWILAADTVVVAGQQILGKPLTTDHAREMLITLSGAVHEVHTAVVLLSRHGEVAELVTTRVRFVHLSQSEIDWYISTGEPDGKAGAYAIQGRASRFVDWIEGSWSNVVGLPVATVYRLLRQSGVLS